jgi:hypothetical protein
MNRNVIRIAGFLLLLFFAFIFFTMYKQLVFLQEHRQPATTSTRLTPLR